MGPNVKRLVAYRASQQAIPSGGNFQTGLQVIMSGKLQEYLREASVWVQQAIAVVKTAPDNPYGDDDEAIAGEILRQLDEKKRNRV